MCHLFLTETEKNYSNKYVIMYNMTKENFENEEKIRNYKEQPKRLKKKINGLLEIKVSKLK